MSRCPDVDFYYELHNGVLTLVLSFFRSAGVDVGVEIAKALNMNYAFVCEFTELRSNKRSIRDQGGGVHGNAILSRYDIISAEALKHTHHPIDWESGRHPKARSEPRKGERLTLCCLLEVDNAPLVVYSCHLEVILHCEVHCEVLFLGVLWTERSVISIQ